MRADPFLIVFRAFSTILAGVLLADAALAPSELRLEDARELKIESHGFSTKGGRTTLTLRGESGRRQRASCDHYESFCAALKSGLPPDLRIWQVDLGLLQGPALAQATAGDVDLVPLAESNAGYVAVRSTIGYIKLFFVALALFAWRKPLFGRLLRRTKAA